MARQRSSTWIFLLNTILPHWVVVKAGRSTVGEFWLVGFHEDHYITTKILSHLWSEIVRFYSFNIQSHHRVFPVTLNVFRPDLRLSRLFLELRDLISLYFSETSVQVDMARVQGDTARHILWEMKRNVQKFKQRLQWSQISEIFKLEWYSAHLGFIHNITIYLERFDVA